MGSDKKELIKFTGKLYTNLLKWVKFQYKKYPEKFYFIIQFLLENMDTNLSM